MSMVVAFQGSLGAYSDLAARSVFPQAQTLSCLSFEDTFEAIWEREAEYAIIPIDNSVTGRVADIHRLLPESRLFIVGEHYQRIDHHLLGVPGSRLEQVQRARSHVQALEQCRMTLRALKIRSLSHSDTAASALEIRNLNDPREAAIASALAAEIYGLEILVRRIQDTPSNTTRFLIMSREYTIPESTAIPSITSVLFEVRSVPAALFKALGGFATNGINLTKLESYIIDDRFTAAQFYIEIESHVKEPKFEFAIEELKFFAQNVQILGCYPQHAFRQGLLSEESR